MSDGGYAILDWSMSVDGDADLSEYEDSGEEVCEIEWCGLLFVCWVFD